MKWSTLGKQSGSLRGSSNTCKGGGISTAASINVPFCASDLCVHSAPRREFKSYSVCLSEENNTPVHILIKFCRVLFSEFPTVITNQPQKRRAKRAVASNSCGWNCSDWNGPKSGVQRRTVWHSNCTVWFIHTWIATYQVLNSYTFVRHMYRPKMLVLGSPDCNRDIRNFVVTRSKMTFLAILETYYKYKHSNETGFSKTVLRRILPEPGKA